jgi:hypothetical protein
MSDRIDTELALGALGMAAATRALEPNWIHHTDRGCRCAAMTTSQRSISLARVQA